MPSVSVTSSDSFAARAQRSEAKRIIAWTIALVGLALVTITRRVFGGAVMAADAVFIPFMTVVSLGIVCQIVVFAALKRANRLGYLLPRWISAASSIFDLCIVVLLLVIVGYFSPRGPVPALSGSTMLFMPMVMLMSVLRLRPKFTLVAGLAGAMAHLAMTIRAIIVTNAPIDAYPVYFAYAAVLALIALMATIVSSEVRTHVREAADDAAKLFRMDHDLLMAKEIQQGLFPTRPPSLDGFEITGMNRPADQTGGDYYDWQPLPDGRLVVVLADVSGHGIGPAIVMAVCRAYARATAPSMPDPASFLNRLNELLHDDLPDDRFITLVVAILSPDGSVDLISAGHGPTLLYTASSKSVTRFDSDGFPLAVTANSEYGPVRSMTLDEGDVLMMLTDGFFESHVNDSELFGIPRLESAFTAAAEKDAQGILRSIDDTVRKFCNGSPQSDDMTAIVIKRTRPATAAEAHSAAAGSVG